MCDFNNEWVTIPPHRFRISVRVGYPDEYLSNMARIVATGLQYNAPQTRIFSFEYDDRYSIFTFLLITTISAEMEGINTVLEAVETLYSMRNFQLIPFIVPAPKSAEDNYENYLRDQFENT